MRLLIIRVEEETKFFFFYRLKITMFVVLRIVTRYWTLFNVEANVHIFVFPILLAINIISRNIILLHTKGRLYNISGNFIYLLCNTKRSQLENRIEFII